MSIVGDRDLLLLLIEQLGRDWRDSLRAEDIRLSQEKIDVLLNVNAMIDRKDASITADDLRERCPVFCEVYRDVMLRDVQEQSCRGISDT